MNTATMPFLNADNHILHQDSLALDTSTYWPEQQHQPLLDGSYIDPETVMSASEALMRLSEQDLNLNIEPTLRGLNVDDSATYQTGDLMPVEMGYAVGPSHDEGPQPRLQLPPRESWDGGKMRAWTEQFEIAKGHAGRWSSGSGETGAHRESNARKTSTISKTPSSNPGVVKQAAAKVGQ
ncbi:hypothetical protein PRZ48_001890 [Zasmidium cellare]|uniref:Uncharacterized protein n=1 Tax=Zasmidium cellare TaxID=395010 RepID=A0ABR0F2H3_ZASCE|nr:hypothetical protein PRZ48_001890 [Zasmidium cellare]